MRNNILSRSAKHGWLLTFVGLFLFSGCNETKTSTSSEPPAVATQKLPTRLSQTNLFADLKSLTPSPAMIAYSVNVPFWSDGASKRRWIILPRKHSIGFSATDKWEFEPGTIFVKHFEFDENQRIETRVLVTKENGNVFGASYRWRADRSDADLVPTGQTHIIDDTHRWYFPGTQDCQTCHMPASGGVLGVNTRQLNRLIDGSGTNQLAYFDRSGCFKQPLPAAPESYPSLTARDDSSRPLADRARSFIDVNCAQCHRPGGVAGNFDARFDVPLENQRLINGNVLINLGIDHAKVIAPADVWRSILLNRVETSDGTRMPPIASLTVDRADAQLLRDWITSMPGKKVLDPPVLSPAGGEFRSGIAISLSHPVSDAKIHYTTDGSLPTKSSPLYDQPIHLSEPATLRARAFKDGMMQSIAVQQTFIVRP